jgi:type I restriction enzyme S subunit
MMVLKNNMKKFREVQLGEVLKYEQPTKYIVESDQYKSEYKTPVLTPGKSFLLGYTNETQGIFTELPVIIFDDFTTAFKYVDFPFKVKSSAMKILKADPEKADIRFLYYRMLKTGIDTTLHKRYWISKYSKIKIPLPPLDQQKKIAAILDAADAYRQKTKALLSKYDELTQSLFLDMFGDPVTNPKGWEKKKFNEVGSLDRGKSKHRPRNAPELLGGEYPLIQTGDVANSAGYITQFTSTYSELGLSQSKMWKAGTLCITIAANIAKTGILTFDACFPDSVVGFIPNQKTNNEFIQMWISFLQKILEDTAPESAQKNINLAILRNLDVIFPPIDLQNQFAERVQAIEEQKAQAEVSLAKAEDLFNSLLQKAFKGELV